MRKSKSVAALDAVKVGQADQYPVPPEMKKPSSDHDHRQDTSLSTILGRERSEMQSKNLFEFLHPDERLDVTEPSGQAALLAAARARLEP